jgi:hypothetical protein
MTQRWHARAALAALVGLGLAAGLARAQGPAPPFVPTADPQPAAIIDYGAGGSAAATPPPEMPAAAPSKGPVRDWAHKCLNAHGVCCWSHHNAYICGSWKSECTFVFGSCREFFGEPCLQGPPPPPWPPGYGPNAQTGYGPNAQTGYGANAQKSGCPFCQ